MEAFRFYRLVLIQFSVATLQSGHFISRFTHFCNDLGTTVHRPSGSVFLRLITQAFSPVPSKLHPLSLHTSRWNPGAGSGGETKKEHGGCTWAFHCRMSEVRLNIPRAHAWTFVCDSPPKALARRSTAVARGERRTGSVPWAKKGTNATISSRFAGNSDSKREEADIMGLCSSRNKIVVAEKENAGDFQETNAGSSSQTANSGGTGDSKLSASGDPNPTDAKTAPNDESIGKLDIALERKKGVTSMEVEEPVLLDSTALLTPDPVEDVLSGDAPGMAEAGAGGGLRGQDATLGDQDEGLEEKGDRLSWIVRKLGELGSCRAVDVAQLEQVTNGSFHHGVFPLSLYFLLLGSSNSSSTAHYLAMLIPVPHRAHATTRPDQCVSRTAENVAIVALLCEKSTARKHRYIGCATFSHTILYENREIPTHKRENSTRSR